MLTCWTSVGKDGKHYTCSTSAYYHFLLWASCVILYQEPHTRAMRQPFTLQPLVTTSSSSNRSRQWQLLQQQQHGRGTLSLRNLPSRVSSYGPSNHPNPLRSTTVTSVRSAVPARRWVHVARYWTILSNVFLNPKICLCLYRTPPVLFFFFHHTLSIVYSTAELCLFSNSVGCTVYTDLKCWLWSLQRVHLFAPPWWFTWSDKML